MHIRVIAFIIAVFTLFALAGPVPAEETGGRLIAVKGKVWTQKPGDEELRARVGKTLANGTKIRTGDNGRAEVVFEDGSSIIVHNNTTMVISGIKRHQVEKTSILIFFGRVWNKVATKIGSQVSYEVNTPVVVCGVRGTEFETAVGEDGSVLVLVDKGEVAVAGDGKSETLKRNQKVEAAPGKGLGRRSESVKKPDWNKWRKEKRENLRKNGKNLVDNLKNRINKQEGKLKGLRGRQKEIEKKYSKALKKARTGDKGAIDEAGKHKEKLNALADEIADLGDIAACQFGIVNHFGKMAVDPRFKMINRKYVKKKTKSIRRNKATIEKMIKKGRGISPGKKTPKPDPDVTVSPIKYNGPDPQVTVSAIKYNGPDPAVTVSKIVYEGKTLKRSKSAMKARSKKRVMRPALKRMNTGLKLTPLPPGSRSYKPGMLIPIQVAAEAKIMPVLIFEFQEFSGRLWRKMPKQRLTKPKTVQRAGKLTQTRSIRFAKPGKYRWRCSADKGRSWSVWSKPFEVIQAGIQKKPQRIIKKTPVIKRSIISPIIKPKTVP